MDIRLHDIILSNSVHIIITFHNCLVRYVGARNSHPVCQVFLYGLFMSHAHYLPQEPQTVRHSFSRREACGCFGSLVTRSLLKVRVYRLSHRRYSIRAILRVIYRFLADSFEARGGGKSVFVVRGRAKIFFSVKITSDSRFGANRTLRIT